MEELFVTYTEGQRYIEREIKNLTELYAGYLSGFTRYHVIMAFSLTPLTLLTSIDPGTGREIN